MELTLGPATTAYVNTSAELVALVPLGVSTVTSTAPVPAGERAVMELALSVLIVAAVEPKSTSMAPARLVPVMVTVVPPLGLPDPGDTEVTLGPAT